MSEIREKTIAGLKPGDTFRVSRTFTEEDTRAFGELSRDYNPVHYDERFAEVKGFKGKICHGLLVAGMLCEVGGQIGWLASAMNINYLKPTYFGDTVRCIFTIVTINEKNRAEADVEFINQHGTRVIEAKIWGIIPGEPEKEVMKIMGKEGGPAGRSMKN